MMPLPAEPAVQAVQSRQEPAVRVLGSADHQRHGELLARLDRLEGMLERLCQRYLA